MKIKPLLSVLIVSLLVLGTTLPAITASTNAFDAATKPKLWVTPLILDFGPVGVGTTSPVQTVTITNLGTATLTNFAGGGVSSPFYATQNCASGVAPGTSCQYFFSFTPTATGTFTTTSSSYTNAGTFSIELRGTGVGAELHVNPLSLDFGLVMSGTTSTQQIVTIRNVGMSTLTNFAGGGVYPPFSATQNCASGVAPGASCQYFFNFSPTDTGTFSTTSNSSTNAGSFSIALEGRGRDSFLVGGQRVTPRVIDFGPVAVGATSGQQIVTIVNQSLFFTITNFMGGGVAPPFAALQNCAPELPPGESCQFFYRFTPTEAMTYSTTSNVSDSFGLFSIQLRGTGVGAGLHVTPLALDFGPVPLNTTSTPQTVTIRNTGATTLTNFAGGGVYPPFSATQNCASGVAPGASCQYFFRFAPTSAGRYTAMSNSSTNGGTFSIQLYGGEKLSVFLPLMMRQ
ncbi:MAG: choice-of-anchor D domain-containing protein [Anaerolineae bacterium]|nr:choice-of-anchor D domain-containing protein [Anaerolineae bacterium]